jgi:hypothetical protein
MLRKVVQVLSRMRMSSCAASLVGRLLRRVARALSVATMVFFGCLLLVLLAPVIGLLVLRAGEGQVFSVWRY